MRRVDHVPGALEDADVHDARGAVAARGPEQQVAGPGVGAGQVVAEGGVVLRLGGAGDGFVLGLADGVLG